MLTALLTESGEYPLTGTFSGGNASYEIVATRANTMATLSDMAFHRDNPQAVVACSPFTGVFYNSGDGVWRDLARYLPSPFTPVSALGIDCEAVYVASEGRGLMRIVGYDNAPAVNTPHSL